jgi:AbrB family looped-hinge helix DNA binding protein
MAVATMTSKGQITVPAEVRGSLGLAPGDRIDFVEESDGQFAIFKREKSLERLKGIIAAPPEPVTVEQMKADAMDGAAESAGFPLP